MKEKNIYSLYSEISWILYKEITSRNKKFVKAPFIEGNLFPLESFPFWEENEENNWFFLLKSLPSWPVELTITCRVTMRYVNTEFSFVLISNDYSLTVATLKVSLAVFFHISRHIYLLTKNKDISLVFLLKNEDKNNYCVKKEFFLISRFPPSSVKRGLTKSVSQPVAV